MKFLIAMMFILNTNVFAAEKERGYCGRIIDAKNIPQARYTYDQDEGLAGAFVLAIECSSYKIESDTNISEIIRDSNIAYAIILEGPRKRLTKLADKRAAVCVRARWGSPGPCNGEAKIESIYTISDNIHSIVPIEKETFSKRYYPYGKLIN